MIDGTVRAVTAAVAVTCVVVVLLLLLLRVTDALRGAGGVVASI